MPRSGNAKKTARRHKRPSKRVWNKEAVREHFQMYHGEGRDLRPRYLLKFDSGLLRAVYMFYETWVDAMEDAGVPFDCPPRRIRWTPEKVVEEIKKRHREKKSLACKRAGTEDYKLVHGAKRHFGSWGKAVEAAGFNYEEILQRRPWTAEEVLEHIHRLKSDGAKLSARAASENHGKLYHAAVRWFGGWGTAVRAAGLDYEWHTPVKHWNKEKVMESIRRRLERGGEINERAVMREEGKLHFAAIRHFGAWRNAVRSAGINYDEHMKTRHWNSAKVIAAIRERMKQGKGTRYHLVSKDDSGLLGAALRHIGSWKEAVERAERRFKQRRWSEEKVVEAIKRRKKFGGNLKASVVAREDSGLVRAAYRHIGSWTEAVEAAGK